MAQTVTEAGRYSRFTATNTTAGPLWLLGVFVSTTSSGTFQISEGAVQVTGTVTPTAGTFYPIPAYLATSCVVTVTGMLDATLIYS